MAKQTVGFLPHGFFLGLDARLSAVIGLLPAGSVCLPVASRNHGSRVHCVKNDTNATTTIILLSWYITEQFNNKGVTKNENKH